MVGTTYDLLINSQSFLYLFELEKNKYMLMDKERPVSNVSINNPSYDRLNNKTLNFGIGIINSPSVNTNQALYNFEIKTSIEAKNNRRASKEEKKYKLENKDKEFYRHRANFKNILEMKNHSINTVNSNNNNIDYYSEFNASMNSERKSQGSKLIEDAFNFDYLNKRNPFQRSDSEKQQLQGQKTKENNDNYIDLMTFDNIKGFNNTDTNAQKNNFRNSIGAFDMQKNLIKEDSISIIKENFDPLNVIEAIYKKNKEINKRNFEKANSLHLINFLQQNKNANGNHDQAQSMININNHAPPVQHQAIDFGIYNNPNFQANNFKNNINNYNYHSNQ